MCDKTDGFSLNVLHVYNICITFVRYRWIDMRGVRLQWAVLIAQGGSRGRAGSSWFLSLRLRLAINVFSCIFSNGVMRKPPYCIN